jgi:hypothetical protein
MKKLFLAVLAVSLALAGCATTQAPIVIAPITPAQLLTQINTVVCPVYDATATAIETTPGVDPAVATSLQAQSAKVDKVCALSATLDATNLQTLADSSVPVILAIAESLPPSPQRDAAIAAITIAKTMLPVLIAQVKAIAAAQPIPSAGTPSAVTPAPSVVA